MKPSASKLAAARALLASLSGETKSGAGKTSADGGADASNVLDSADSPDTSKAAGNDSLRDPSEPNDLAELTELGKLAELRAAKTYSGPSLKARALKMLALRDLSSAELRRKLRAVVTATPEMGKTVDDVDELLADFTARGWQSDARFAEQLARRRSKFGNARLAQELKSHGLDKTTVAGTLDAASGSEYARALAAWQKKFSVPATTAKDRAKQGRFLAARGFSADVMRRVLREAGAEPESDE